MNLQSWACKIHFNYQKHSFLVTKVILILLLPVGSQASQLVCV